MMQRGMHNFNYASCMDPNHGMEARKGVQDVPLVSLHAHPGDVLHVLVAVMHTLPHALLVLLPMPHLMQQLAAYRTRVSCYDNAAVGQW